MKYINKNLNNNNIRKGIFVLGLILVFKLEYYWLHNSGITKGYLTSLSIYSLFYIKYFIVLIDFDIFKFELQNQRLFKIR